MNSLNPSFPAIALCDTLSIIHGHKLPPSFFFEVRRVVSKHLERDIQALEQELLHTSGMVERMIEKAWRSLIDRNDALANEVIQADEAVDAREVRIEEECLKILALHQPVAIDLRRTATILKVNNDLERIADLAVNIAERSLKLNSMNFPFPGTLANMSSTARHMLRDVLNALVALDPAAALEVRQVDDQVDRSHAVVVSELYQLMRDEPQYIAGAIHCLSVARHIERIADHATNIAEDVVYLVTGEISRHQHAEFPSA